MTITQWFEWKGFKSTPLTVDRLVDIAVQTAEQFKDEDPRSALFAFIGTQENIDIGLYKKALQALNERQQTKAETMELPLQN